MIASSRAAPNAGDERAVDAREHVRRLLASRDLLGAIESAIELDPSDGDAWLVLGAAQLDAAIELRLVHAVVGARRDRRVLRDARPLIARALMRRS